MASSSPGKASVIAKLIDEANTSGSPEFTEVVMEYFTHPLLELDDSDESQPNLHEEELFDDDEGSDNGEENFPIIKDFGCRDLNPSDFVNMAGKIDKKGQYPFICSCKYNAAQPCSLLFTPVELSELRMQHLSLSRDELDLILLSQIRAGIHDTKETQRPKQKEQTHRKKVRMDYHFKGKKICRDTFMFIHGIFKDRLCSLIQHYQQNGMIVRVQRNKNCLPRNGLTFQQRQDVVTFVSNYAEQHAILVPGRVPGYARSDLKLLPSSCTKTSVYDCYLESCRAGHTKSVCLTSFLQLWRECMPDVLPMKPASDLCWTCQRNSMLLSSVANLTEEEKLERLREAERHILTAKAARTHYNAIVLQAKNEVKEKHPMAQLQKPGHNLPDCGVELVAHYSFDFTQQVHYPSNPLQPGPIYFKTPRKCAVFGVMTEAIPQMALFLLDEAVDVGKGPNTVISLLDYFFEHLGLKETECHLHANNCGGQNKNNAMLQYLLWRVMTKRHRQISLSFLVAGHTKFGPDWCFGLFKRTFRRMKVNCLEDIAKVARCSSHSGLLQPHLCGTEDGSPLIPVRNWSQYLEQYYYKLIGLKKFHHFVFTKSGEVQVRLTCESQEQVINLLKGTNIPPADDIAPIIKPTGLSRQRKDYLYKKIREFVAPEHQDLVCPPVIPQSSSGASQPSASATNSRPHASTPSNLKRKPGRPKKSLRGLAAKKSVQ